MSVYDDPDVIAGVLQSAADYAETQGEDGERIGIVILRAAERHLRDYQKLISETGLTIGTSNWGG